MLAAVVGGAFIAALDTMAELQSSFDALFGLLEVTGIQLRSGVLLPIDGGGIENLRKPTSKLVVNIVPTAVALLCLPLWGRLWDSRGGRGLWLIGLLLFMAGSVGLATSREQFPSQFLAADVVQALGVGAIFTLSRALVGEIYPPSERAKGHGLLLAAIGLGLFGSPTVSHLLQSLPPADEIFGDEVLHVSGEVRLWPTVVNLAIGALVCMASWVGLRSWPARVQGPVSISGAAVLLLAASVPLLVLLGVSFATDDVVLPWLTRPMLEMFAGAGAAFGVLVLVVGRVAVLVINLRLLTNRIFLTAIVLQILVSVALANVQYLTELFGNHLVWSDIYGDWALRYVDQLAFAMAFALGAIVAGQVMSRTGRFKRLVLVLLAVSLIGTLQLSRLTGQSTVAEIMVGLVIVLLGLGGMFAVLVAIAQNAHPRRFLGEVSAGLEFYPAVILALLSPILLWLRRAPFLDPLADLPPVIEDYDVVSIAKLDVVGVLFVVTAAIIAIGFVVALWFPEPLRSRETVKCPSLDENLRAGEEEQRHRETHAAEDDSGAEERPVDDQQPPAT